jgi:hypothetical protein
VRSDRTNVRMVRHLRAIACVLLPLSLSGIAVLSLPACGGGKKAPKDPVVKNHPSKDPTPPTETEEDREKKRLAAAKEIVPAGSNCLPDALKGGSAPRLELAAISGEAVVCAIDHERDRLLGPVACWKVDVQTGDLEYQKPAPIPGRGFPVRLEEHCARGYCLPKDAKGDAKIAHMVWSPDGSKVAVQVGDDIHLYDAASKAHESKFSIRGDKGVSSDPIRLYWVGDSIFVEGSDGATTSPVWVFKAADGTQMGALEPIGKAGKPLSTHGGSFVILDENRVGISEQGFSSMVTYEVASGKRAKVVRNKIPKTPCKADETDAYWSDNVDKVSAKCKDFMTKNFAYLVGADAVAGKKNLLVLLRDARLGEMAVMDAKTLTESKAIRLPWCSDEGGGGKPEKAEKPAKGEKAEKAEKPAKGEKAEKPAKPAKGEKAEKPAKGEKAEKDE